jgi:hypothetical protein
MQYGYQACTVMTLWVAMAAAIVAGCANPPPPRAEPTSLPQTGDTIEQIAARGYEVALVFALASDSHEYAYLVAHSTASDLPLIQIDGKMACGQPYEFEPAEQSQDVSPQQSQDVSAQQWFLYQFEARPESQPQAQAQPEPQTAPQSPSTTGHRHEFTQWQWVAQPDGLRYLASQIRQACDLEPDTEPQSLPSLWTKRVKEAPPPQASSDESIGEVLLQILIGVPVIVMAAPYVIAGETATLVVSAPWIAAEHAANTRQLEQREQIHLGLTRRETESLLGKPEAEFTLDPVQTTVLMYEAGESPQNYFVGFQDDAIVWIHAQDEWLEHLAKRAEKERK